MGNQLTIGITFLKSGAKATRLVDVTIVCPSDVPNAERVKSRRSTTYINGIYHKVRLSVEIAYENDAVNAARKRLSLPSIQAFGSWSMVLKHTFAENAPEEKEPSACGHAKTNAASNKNQRVNSA